MPRDETLIDLTTSGYRPMKQERMSPAEQKKPPRQLPGLGTVMLYTVLPGVFLLAVLSVRASHGPVYFAYDPDYAYLMNALGDGQHVLVVEDDKDVRAIVVSQLIGLGYEVSEAENAHAALGLLQTEAPFDLLFSDVVMPGRMNGVELIQAARELRPDLRAALTTGYSDDVIQRGGEDFGDYVLVRKPCKRHELAAAIAQALGN